MEMVQAASRVGFDNITIDLMYDVPGQTLDQWRNTLSRGGGIANHSPISLQSH